MTAARQKDEKPDPLTETLGKLDSCGYLAEAIEIIGRRISIKVRPKPSGPVEHLDLEAKMRLAVTDAKG